MLWIIPALTCVHGRAGAAGLVWEAPPGCPEQDEIERRIAASLGEPLDRVGEATFSGRITHPEGQPWRLTIHMPGAEGAHERRFSAGTCAELGDAAVAAITFALTVESREEDATEPADSDERPAPALESAPSERSKARASAASSRSASRRQRRRSAERGAARPFFASIAIGPLLDVGALPKPSVGAAPVVHLGYRAASLRAGALVLPEQKSLAEEGLSGDPDAGGEFRLVAGSSALCLGAGTRPGRLRLCSGIEAGRLTGRGRGVDFSSEVDATWLAVPADASFELPLGEAGPFAVVGAGAAFPLRRTEFTLREVGLAHQPASLVWRVFLGLGWLARMKGSGQGGHTAIR